MGRKHRHRCDRQGCFRIWRLRTLIGLRFCRQHWQEFYRDDGPPAWAVHIPVFADGTQPAAYSTLVGHYTKIGDVVTANATITVRA